MRVPVFVYKLVCVCFLRVKAAAVIQPAAREEVSEGPGSRHLTGPASHRAHRDQRYFVLQREAFMPVCIDEVDVKGLKRK